ncbi:hypothetical protein IM793_12775 [Pedobacter sp. MR2016-19]|uniref:hypothetical protein n=1 Tax=Pedobacter sp. MR2016-19 TaxID=2780089 RepID=UPI001875F774|nr:hypothetical protein [Pedobacter sp. MR2016-19]MBE5320039.1 hypothetical protein [Pedobacter sp. MR2016-19]
MDCNNPIICSKHGTLVSLSEHCNNLFRFFRSEHPYDDDPVRNWFKVSSGIKGIDYDEGMFDITGSWCQPAFAYDEAMTKHLSDLIYQLTNFSLIWGGFESFVENLDLPDCPHQRGKINKASYFLKEKYDSNFKLPEYYKNLVTMLENYLKLSASFTPDPTYFTRSDCAGSSGAGITIVKKIRNKFAHGIFDFGEPAQYESTGIYHGRIIHISCRIVLITIQMILVAVYKQNHFNVEKRNEQFEEGTLNSQDFLFNLHLRNYNS